MLSFNSSELQGSQSVWATYTSQQDLGTYAVTQGINTISLRTTSTLLSGNYFISFESNDTEITCYESLSNDTDLIWTPDGYLQRLNPTLGFKFNIKLILDYLTLTDSFVYSLQYDTAGNQPIKFNFNNSVTGSKLGLSTQSTNIRIHASEFLCMNQSN